MFNHPDFYANLLLSVLFISIFIAIFFFTYASRIEKQIVVNQTKDVVNYFTDSIQTLYPNSPLISNFINDLKAPDMKKDDEKVASENKKLFDKSLLLICISSSIVLLIYFDSV